MPNRTFAVTLAFVFAWLFGLPAVPAVDPVLPALACPASGGGDTDQPNTCPDDPGTATPRKSVGSSGGTPPRITGGGPPGGTCVTQHIEIICYFVEGEEVCVGHVFLTCM